MTDVTTPLPDSSDESPDEAQEGRLTGHAGELAVAVARAHGVETMFTLSGAHVFPMYDGAVKADPPMRLLDVRHEQTAAFAAEATGKLTRVPGLAVLTAGPGVTNGVSAIAQAQFAGSPMVVVGGRAPANRWGSGSLQELDQPPIVAPIAKAARTLHTAGDVLDGHGRGVHRRRLLAPRTGLRRRPDGRVLQLRVRGSSRPHPRPRRRARPRRGHRDRRAARAAPRARCSSSAPTSGPTAPRRPPCGFVEAAGIPTITNGMGRGVVPGGHPLLVTKARGQALGGSDLVVVVGTPLDFRLGYGVFGGKDGAAAAQVVHVADSPGQVSGHAELAGVGVRRPDRGPRRAARRRSSRSCAGPTGPRGSATCRRPCAAATERDADLLGAEADPIHPARIYGELVPRLADDAVVIGDGGDFVSFAGKFVEPQAPRRLARPRPLRLPRRRARLRRSRPGSPARRRRSCCCSATAPPASR